MVNIFNTRCINKGANCISSLNIKLDKFEYFKYQHTNKYRNNYLVGYQIINS